MADLIYIKPDGDNGSSVFEDLSGNDIILTANGGVQYSTAHAKFGASSIAFDGDGDYISVASSALPDITTSDFTMECWVSLSSTATQSIYSKWTYSANYRWDFYISGSGLYFKMYDSSPPGLRTYSGAYTFALGVFYHVAVVRSGSNIYLFVNGIQVSPVGTMNVGYSDSVNPLTIGRQLGGSQYFSGYIDEIRIRNEAVWTENFTPPIGSYWISYVISGIIRDGLGNPCQRKVYTVSRPTDATAPQILAHGLSDATTGAYELILRSDEEVTRVVVSEDDDPLLNDIVDRVIPE